MPFIINQRRPYTIYVEAGSGGAMAHVAELPGCFAAGSSAPLAVAAVPNAIAGFLAWLKGHREPLVPEAIVSRPTMSDLSVAEVRSEGASSLQAGSNAALFEFDKAAWDDYKLERTLRWLAYSRADLLAKIDGMAEADLKARRIAPGRTLWLTLWHLADAELGYVNSIHAPLQGVDEVTDSAPTDVRERLAAVRDTLVRSAWLVPGDRRGDVISPKWAAVGDPMLRTERTPPIPDSPWTLPKALRRALEHELEHSREL